MKRFICALVLTTLVFGNALPARSEDGANNTGVKKIRAYVDADTANEVDDPYAIYRALVAPELEVVGLSSMAWGSSKNFEQKMLESQKMNEEMLDMLELTSSIPHPTGAVKPMDLSTEPVDSPAARDIIAKAKETPEGEKLHVFVLGAYTNVASAMLIDPSIKDKLAVHVMGYNYENGKITEAEFNCHGDVKAAMSLLKSGVELNLMPITTLKDYRWPKSDVDKYFKGQGSVKDYLVRRWESHAPNDKDRILWDIAVFEAILRPELATLEHIDVDGKRVGMWTKVDLQGMQSDFWKATQGK